MENNRKETSSADTAAADPVLQPSIDERIEKIRAWAQRYAKKHGLLLNPNEKELKTVLRGLATNQARFKRQYCPCRLRSGDPEKDKQIICPCSYHRDEITKEGHCHCRLFFRADSGGKEGTPHETP